MTRNNVVPGVPSFREELDVSMTTIRVPFRKNGKDSFLGDDDCRLAVQSNKS